MIYIWSEDNRRVCISNLDPLGQEAELELNTVEIPIPQGKIASAISNPLFNVLTAGLGFNNIINRGEL